MTYHVLKSLTSNNALIVGSLALSSFIYKSTALSLFDNSTYAAFALLLSLANLCSGLYILVFGDIGLLKKNKWSLRTKLNYIAISLFLINILAVFVGIIFLYTYSSFLPGSYLYVILAIACISFFQYQKSLFYIFDRRYLPLIFSTVYLISSLGFLAYGRIYDFTTGLNGLFVYIIIVTSMMLFISSIWIAIKGIEFPKLSGEPFGLSIDNLKSAYMYVLVWITSQGQWFVLGIWAGMEIVGMTLGLLILAGPLQLIERILQPKYLIELSHESDNVKKLNIFVKFFVRNLLILTSVFVLLVVYSNNLFDLILPNRNYDHLLLYHLYFISIAQVATSGLSSINRSRSNYKSIFLAYSFSPLVLFSYLYLLKDSLQITTLLNGLIISLLVQLFILTISSFNNK